MNAQILEIAGLLMTLPDDVRLKLARHLLPDGHAIVSRTCDGAVEDAFRATASRCHSDAKAELRFVSPAIRPCWEAMVAVAAAQVVRQGSGPVPHLRSS